VRVLYLGTPAFAVPTLEKLIAWPECQVVGVVTQPDRAVGRHGSQLQAPPTKVVAQQHGIPVLQPEKLSKAPEIVEQMRALQPDVLVMVAFGQILRKVVLEMAPMGVVNLHGSLLPKYRGAAPINWAIINGETITGATTMFSDPGVDTGAMLLKCEIPITPEMTAVELADVMSKQGADLMIETLAGIKSGAVKPQPQDSSQATMAPMLTKEMGVLDWTKSAWDLHNLVRGLQPWPGTQTVFQGAPLKVLKTLPPQAGKMPALPGSATQVLPDSATQVLPGSATQVLPGSATQVLPDSGTQDTPLGSDRPGAQASSLPNMPGTIVAVGDAVDVACGPNGEEVLRIVEVQPANKSRMKARDWANGARVTAGLVLG
jgi:methionyl-tRNA formyltransferase